MHRRATHCLRILLLVGAAALLRCSPSFAAEQPQEQKPGPPRLTAARVDAPPVLDGALDDPCWQDACHVEGFWREKLDAPEFEPTEAWICYDSHALYVAFRSHDSQPSEIRAVQTKRQGSMGNDDRVTVRLDVEDGGRNEYQFRVNALGTQSDEIPGGTSEKIEWKGDWRAAARTDDAGWNAEIAIPFSILRYPDGQRSFRVVLERSLSREDDDSVWPPEYARLRDSENCARLTDIATPLVPFRYVLMPYALSVLSEDEEGREALTGGLDFKGTFPNSVVALGTYNPDFYNLEDVVESIDFTFVERYLPEYRPFFQEGSGYMPSGEEWDPVNLLYTRRIEKLDWGAKTFGTVGPHRFGVFDAYRRGGENHFAWNYDHLIDTNGSVGFSGVDRRVPGEPDNQTYSLGSHWHFPYPGGHRSFGGDWYQSRTDGEGGDDAAFSIDASVWPQQGFGGWIGYNAIGANFQADDGYVPETGVRSLSAGLSHERSYDEGPLSDAHWELSASAGDSDEGARRDLHLSHGRSWRSGWEAFAGLTRGERDGYDVIGNSLGIQWNHRDTYRRGGFHVAYGEHYGEPYRYQSLSQAFRPAERWSAEFSFERAHSAYFDDDGIFVPAELSRQLVLTTTYDLSDERTASARFVRTDSNTNVYAAYRQRVRRGMDLLIVVGDPNADQWVSRLAVKAMWCL
jgi:hypothetical protein